MMNKEELLKLKTITKNEIETVVICHQFSDDNLMCYDVKINGMLVEMHYYDTAGFLEYWDCCDKAKQDLADIVNHCASNSLEDIYDDEATEAAEMNKK